MQKAQQVRQWQYPLGMQTEGTYAKGATGAAMAISIGYALQCPPLVLFSLAAVGMAANELGGAGGPPIGYALQCPPLVLFSLAAVGMAANELGGAGGPLAVLVVTIFAAEFGKLVSKETKIDIIVTPFTAIGVGVLLSLWWAPAIGYAASIVGISIMWATELQPVVGTGNRLRCKQCGKCNYVGHRASAVLYGNSGICNRRSCLDTSNQQLCNLCGTVSYRASRRSSSSRLLCTNDWFCSNELS